MKWPHNNWHERPQPDYWRGTSGSQVWIPARRSLCFIAIVLELIAAAQGESPLARPNRPQAEIRGAPGHRTVTYWQYAADASGHSQYSEPVIVTNAPDVLSEQAAIVVTPAPVEGATEYGLLSSRIEAPGAAKVEVGAPGDRTFYYWFQTRNGRTVWSPVTGPIRVDGCAAKPANKLTWLPTGAEFYYLYRTETPTQPMGWRGCVVLTALPAAHEMAWTDKAPDPDSRIIYPAGTGAQRPEGHGRYLVGRSNGAAIVDKGQELQSVAIYDLNTTDAANRQFKPEVRAYEPHKPDADLPGLQLVPSLKMALEGADGVLLLVAHAQFRQLDPAQIARLTPARFAFDAVNGWERTACSKASKTGSVARTPKRGGNDDLR